MEAFFLAIIITVIFSGFTYMELYEIWPQNWPKFHLICVIQFLLTWLVMRAGDEGLLSLIVSIIYALFILFIAPAVLESLIWEERTTKKLEEERKRSEALKRGLQRQGALLKKLRAKNKK